MAHPPGDQIPARTLQPVFDIVELCLAFPETSEKLAWGHADVPVRGQDRRDESAPTLRDDGYDEVTMTTA